VLVRPVRVFLACLACLLVVAAGTAWWIEVNSQVGANIVIPAVAQASGSEFVAMTVSILGVLPLLLLTMMLIWARPRLALLGWARNRLVRP
jgi:hypothetical protein